MKTLVSVIVPIYKAEKTLPDCINSILNQTYNDFELILVDDGSPDNCGNICDEYAQKDSRIRVVHKSNGGVSSARNIGMDNVQGEYFVCIDSDDIVAPCYLEDLVTTQENHTEFGHVLCGFYSVSQKRNYILNAKETLSIVDRKDYMRLADNVLVQAPWLHLYISEIVKKNKIRMREDLSLAEDLMFNLEYIDALENTTIGVINKPNYVYQDEDVDSLNHKYREDLLELKELVNARVKNYLNKWNVTDEDSWRSYYNSVFYGYLNVLNNTFSEKNQMTEREKTEFNSKILRSDGFKEALSKCSANISLRLRKAYESGNYRQVLIMQYAAEFKYTLKSFIKA